jgi:hypothetical protein
MLYTFELNNAQRDPHAYMLANEATGSRFPNISHELSKLSTLYRFLDKHRNVSPANINITEHGKPLFSSEDMNIIMNQINAHHNTVPNIPRPQRGGTQATSPIALRDPTKSGYDPKDDMFGATQRPDYQEPPHPVEFWENVFHSLYNSYEKSPFYLHFSEKWDGVWWYFYLLYNLEHMDIFGPYISIALDAFTINIPALGEAIEVVLHYGAGLVGGFLTAGLAIGPAAETGSMIADVIAAFMALVGAVISISRKRTGDAFKLLISAIPFDIGATLNMYANGIEKQYSRYLINRERIINTFKPVPTLQTWLDYYVPEVGEDKGPPPPPITVDAIKQDLVNTAMEKTGADKALAKLQDIQADPLGAAARASGTDKVLAKVEAARANPMGTLAPFTPTLPEMPPLPQMPAIPAVNSARVAFAPIPARKRGGGKTRKHKRRRRKNRHTSRHTSRRR